MRLHAARHSARLMWVPLSQKPMQACKVSPPPPGVLGADSLGLAPDNAAEPTPVREPPPPLDSRTGPGLGEGAGKGARVGAGEPIAEGPRLRESPVCGTAGAVIAERDAADGRPVVPVICASA